MVWQDLLFMAGSLLSVVFLAPALRDVDARIPLATSVPKMALGGVYAVTFATMGMSLAAAGLLATGVMWGLLAAYRSPSAPAPDRARPNASLGAVANDGQRPPRRLED